MTQREKFEKWTQPAENRGYDLRKHPNGDYIFNKPQAAWLGYRAGQAALIADIVEKLKKRQQQYMPDEGVIDFYERATDDCIEIVRKAGE